MVVLLPKEADGIPPAVLAFSWHFSKAAAGVPKRKWFATDFEANRH